tara:strand:- start:1444 stop:1947 length:504 start_codon:yes stop_codon:yes gene_type:complete
MGQEFIIKSQSLEDKVNQLLPSQGGFQAGVDLSASTTIIPIVDLTESAEGSSLRQDLQTSLSLTSISFNAVNNTTTNLVNTTGYYRTIGNIKVNGSGDGQIDITDGVTTKNILRFSGSSGQEGILPFDIVVLLQAGDTLRAISSAGTVSINVATRQIADLSGNLVNP